MAVKLFLICTSDLEEVPHASQSIISIYFEYMFRLFTHLYSKFFFIL